MLSIEDCLIRDDPKRDYSDEYSSQINSRFVAGCYKAHMMKFKIRVITPLFLSPDVTYGVNLVFKYSEIEQDERQQEASSCMYKLLGETEIWMVNIGDLREDGWLVAELYHFTNEGEKSILDLEIIFEDCGLSGFLHRRHRVPTREKEQPVLVVEYKEILKHGRFCSLKERENISKEIFIRSSVDTNELEISRGGMLRIWLVFHCTCEKSILDTSDLIHDGWFVVPLYHFTSNHTTADLQFEFEYRITNMSLLVAGFEFQPSQEKVELQVFEEYQHIVEVASQSLFYTSLDELKQILSKGVHLNGYKTECVCVVTMISIQDCLIPNEDFPSQYKSDVWSSSSSYDEQAYVDLKYRLRGETTSFTVYLGKHTDGCLYMAELYQFTSDGSIFDLEIMSFKKMLSGENVSGGLGLQQVEDPYLSNNTENKAIKKNLFSTIGQWFQFNNDTAEDDTLLEATTPSVGTSKGRASSDTN
ncbi:hypothetical protein Tco_1283074 [Tanacetum coccineum]